MEIEIKVDEVVSVKTLEYILDISKTSKDVTKNVRHLINYPFDQQAWEGFHKN